MLWLQGVLEHLQGCSPVVFCKIPAEREGERKESQVCRYATILLLPLQIHDLWTSITMLLGCDHKCRCRLRAYSRLCRPSRPMPLKSVLGSLPWKPISHHCLEMRPVRGVSGRSSFQSYNKQNNKTQKYVPALTELVPCRRGRCRLSVQGKRA